MKRAVFATLIACVLVLGVTTFAESKTILVKTYTNVLVNDTNNYQINCTGDIVTYSIAKDINGIITAIYYTFTRKSGTSVVGQIGPGSVATDNFIPANSVAFEIIGLENNASLVLFTDNVGTRIYMLFRLANKYATPAPNRINPVKHIALANEICSLTSSQILSYLDNPAVVKAVSSRKRTLNIAELTTSANHTLSLGDKVTILDVPDNSYNMANVEVISTPTVTTFTYSCPGEDENLEASTGSAYRPQIFNSVSIFNYNWVPLTTRGISNQWGSLSIINLIMQRYYKGISPTVNSDELEVSILRP